MTMDFDVLIVGGRCAGSPLATLLARGGARVGVVEKVTFPRDTLSTHIFQAAAINFLGRLGVLDEVCATGAPLVNRVDLRQDDFQLAATLTGRPGDRGMAMSVRRFLLDPVLAAEAERSGATLMMRTSVLGVLRDGERGRVAGLRVTHDGREREMSARLVVGADGRNSTVAREVGARRYHVVPSQRLAYYGFFEGAAPEPEPTIVFHRWGGRFVIATPADSGLYEVIVIPDDTEEERARFRADREQAFLQHAMACEPVARVVGSARRVGKLQGMRHWEGYFRESAGLGWALAGDAGHFKDPSPGQGIADAFRQVEALAPAILAALGGGDAELDASVARWARWRDRDALAAHWMAADFGGAGSWPAAVPEMMRRMQRQGSVDDVLDMIQHRISQPEVFTPPRLIAATAALMARPRGADRRGILRGTTSLVREDMRRRRLAVRPVFADQADRADPDDAPEAAAPVAATG
jgi:2-polyprenyl-6-methoxyphenol hydroxylase-like FAD-dependent oxidoreductase